jgi:pimeloyl-ACP methyl ester carboxylesterase
MLFHDALELWPYFPGFSYLFIDYEGYGQNEGQTHYLKMYEEALAVYDYAITRPDFDKDHIVSMGFSLGTGSAVYLAANRPVIGLILAAPYANGYDLYNNVLPIFYGITKPLVKHKLPSDDYAPKVACPVLIFASQSDSIVPFDSSLRLSKLFPGSVDFVAYDGFDHNELFEAEGLYPKIQSFLETVAK